MRERSGKGEMVECNIAALLVPSHVGPEARMSVQCTHKYALITAYSMHCILLNEKMHSCITSDDKVVPLSDGGVYHRMPLLPPSA